MPNDNWISPPEFVEPARALFGGEIDLDPASTGLANKYVVKAKGFYDEGANAFNYKWYGTVWLNPPYSARLISPYINKLAAHYRRGEVPQAVILVNTATETAWYKFLARRYPLLFTEKRISFYQAEQRPIEEGRPLKGTMIGDRIFYKGEQNRVGQTLFYLGPNIEGFYRGYEHLAYAPQGSIKAVINHLNRGRATNGAIKRSPDQG